MNGPFGGPLAIVEGVTREALPEAFAAALAATQTYLWTRPADPPPNPAETAAVVFFSFEADVGVTYEGDLSALRSWTAAALAKPAALTALAGVGRGLAHLHARGVVHGDVRTEMIWIGAGDTATVMVPAHASKPGAALRARLHPGGATATAVGFAAPEAVAAYEVTPATDVYGLAAVVYATLTGYAPLGQVNLKPYAIGAAGELAARLEAALNQVPTLRPTMESLSEALARAARTAAEAPLAAAYRHPAGSASAAEAAAVRAHVTEMSPVLMLVLIVGGFCAFIGAVLLVVAGWDVVGEFGRVAILGVLATLAGLAGSVAARRGMEIGATVGRGLACVFATVAVAYTFSLLDDGGRLALLAMLALGALGSGVVVGRRDAPLGGAVLLALGSQLFWTVGAQLIHMLDVPRAEGPVCALAAVVSATTFALALWRRSGPFGLLAAIDFAVFFGALGEYLKSGAVMGPAGYSLAVAGAYAALAMLAGWRDAKPAAKPLAVAQVIAAAISVATGLAVLHGNWETHALLAAAWPYLVAAAAALLTRAAAPVGTAATFTAGAIVVMAPTAEALLRDERGFTVGAVAVGALVLLAALLRPELRARNDARAEAVLAGLFGMMAAADLRVFHAIGSSGSGWLGSHGLDWTLMAGVSAALLALSYAVTARVGRERFRLLEIAALGQFYGLLTLQTLTTQHELQPAALVLCSSAALLTLGVVTRRAAVMSLSAVALILNAWIQYFVRMEDVFPLSVRLVGFGVGLLVGGVLYEQQLRHRIAQLRRWN